MGEVLPRIPIWGRGSADYTADPRSRVFSLWPHFLTTMGIKIFGNHEFINMLMSSIKNVLNVSKMMIKVWC